MTGIAVAVMVCQTGRRSRPFVHCINVIAQSQELQTGSIIGILVPLGDDQICEGDSVGYCAGVRDGPDMSDCPPHMVTLLPQALEICINLGQGGNIDRICRRFQ